MSIWTDLNDIEFELRRVDAGGIQTRALVAGSGEPLIFLHGTSGHLEAFTRNITAHAAQYQCHAIDMLGHGYTQGAEYPYTIPRYVEHLCAYMDAVGAQSAHLVGESLGGWVAAWLASEHPDRVRKLTLVAPGGSVANPDVMKRIKESTIAAVTQDDIALTRARLDLLMYRAEGNVTDELVETRHRIYHQPSFQERLEYLLCLQEIGTREANLLDAERMARISAQTLVVWARQNPFGDVSEGERMSSMIKNSTLVVLEECGHWPQYEHAEEFNDLNLNFLSGE